MGYHAKMRNPRTHGLMWFVCGECDVDLRQLSPHGVEPRPAEQQAEAVPIDFINFNMCEFCLACSQRQSLLLHVVIVTVKYDILSTLRS